MENILTHSSVLVNNVITLALVERDTADMYPYRHYGAALHSNDLPVVSRRLSVITLTVPILADVLVSTKKHRVHRQSKQ